MPHHHARRSLAAAFVVSTLTTVGCSTGASGKEETAVGSDTPATSSSSPSPSPSTGSPSTGPTALSSSTPSPRPSSPAPAPATPPFVASATWGDSDYGVTLRVAPTPSALRATGPADAATAWAEVLRLAPDADTPGMREQFDCHWTWARLLEPDKPTWNLEPWRPDVTADVMLLEGCNPGGPEV